MSGEGSESNAFNYNISGGHGGTGGTGHGNGGKGGSGGTGEGPTVIFDHSTNKIVNLGQGLKEILEKWLEFPPDTRGRQYELQSLHHEATGRWLLRDARFVGWKDKPGCLWIKGISGTGKSVLSSTVIQEIVKTCPNRSAVSYFYFDFRSKRQRMDIMLRSIVWQLSGRSPFPYRSLCQLHKTLGNGTILPQQVDLSGVLADLLSELDRTYIIMDGLDECNKTDWTPLIQFIHSLCHTTKNAPHLLFTSQPLEEFQTAFNDVTFIELGPEVSNDDISSFVGSRVREVRNWASDDEYAEQVTEQIVQKSNGMFRLAACLLLELGHCRWEEDWEETLTVLPADLFGIYSHFFTRAKDTHNLPTVFIQAIFRWLVFSARQVTLDEMADAISFRLDAPTFDFSDPAKSIYYPNRHQGNSEICKLLEGLVVIKKNDQEELSTINDRNKVAIALAHSSVKDYLLSHEFQQEFGSVIDIGIDASHRFIAQTCVRYLLLFADPKHSMAEDTLPAYPISLYAAEYWFYHLQLCNEQDQRVLLPSTMYLLEDGSSQHTALYKLRPLGYYETRTWDEPISPAVCICAEMGYTKGVHSLLVEHNAPVDLVDIYGWTALHLALSNGHLDIARLLIEHNAPVDLVDIYGQTVLHLALSNGHLDIARLLIEHNTPIDLVNEDGRTALHLASNNCHLDIARLLIEHNAPVDLVDIYGWTALHLASWNGHLDIARLLIEHNTPVNLVDKCGRTALHLALSKGHLEITRLLIEHNTPAELVDDDWSALHLVLSDGHLEITRLLIEHNTSIDIFNKYHRTALHFALSNGHLNIARLLIKLNTPVDLVDILGRTALHLASSNGHLDIVRLLIEHNAPVDLVDKYHQTALHLASSNGHLNIARLLIEHNAPVDLVDIFGQTALHFASRDGHFDIARLLIEHNTPVDLVEKYRETALHLALSKGHLDIARLLVVHNARGDLVNFYGHTALHLALSNGHIDIVRLLIENNTPLDAVDKYGQTKDGQTALHFALGNGHLDIVRLLIEHNAPVNLVDILGRTVLHLASSNGHLNIVRLLIEHNAPVDLVDRYRQTALHLASSNGHLDIARLLIKHDAPVDLIDILGRTALHLASSNGHLDIARLLIEHNTPVDLVDIIGQTALHLASSNGHLNIARLLM